MKAITFTDRAEAEALIRNINTYVGSTAVTDPVESDEGWVVLVPVVTTSTSVINLPALIEGKQFTAPKVEIAAAEPVIESRGTL